jgi:UDP-N-acetylmuramate: L-alanyl-gamma-D-glutamyl-meso-diaminopimelate ligase
MQPVIDGCAQLGQSALLMDDVDAIIAHLVENAQAGDAIVLMSNGGFAGIHQQLANALKDKYGA